MVCTKRWPRQLEEKTPPSFEGTLSTESSRRFRGEIQRTSGYLMQSTEIDDSPCS